jgi:hypothetical protein
MEEENKVVDDNSQTSEEVALETTEEETLESVKAELEKERQARLKSDEVAQNQKIRAEKAEKKAKEVVKEETKTTSDLSSKDLLALMKAEVAEDDVDEVVDYAKYKGISVAEALKTSVIKTSLADKVEQRKIADATNTGVSKRSSAKLADDVLLSNASKGIMPDNDEDLNRLLDLRKNIKR